MGPTNRAQRYRSSPDRYLSTTRIVGLTLRSRRGRVCLEAAMTIIVDIRPEVQAELARQAAAHGRPVEAYAASLLEEAMHLPAVTGQPSTENVHRPRERASASCAKASRLEA